MAIHTFGLLNYGVFTDGVNANSTNCTFHIDECEIPCHFGYEVDAGGCPYENCSCAREGMFEGDIKFDSEDIPFMSKVCRTCLTFVYSGFMHISSTGIRRSGK